MTGYPGGDARANSGATLTWSEQELFEQLRKLQAFQNVPPGKIREIAKFANKKAAVAPTSTGIRPTVAFSGTVMSNNVKTNTTYENNKSDTSERCKVTEDSYKAKTSGNDYNPKVYKALKGIDEDNVLYKDCKTIVANINPAPKPWLDTQLTQNGIVVALGKDFADVGYLKLAPNPESAWGPASGGSSAGGSGSNSGNGATLSYSDDRAA